MGDFTFLFPYARYPCQEALGSNGKCGLPCPRHRSQMHPKKLLRHNYWIEGSANVRDLAIADVQHVDPFKCCAASGGRIAQRTKRTLVSSCDSPNDCASAAVSGRAYGRVNLIAKIGKGLEYGFGKLSHCSATPSRWLDHGRVVPFDIFGQLRNKPFEIARIPSVEQTVRDIRRIDTTRWLVYSHVVLPNDRVERPATMTVPRPDAAHDASRGS